MKDNDAVLFLLLSTAALSILALVYCSIYLRSMSGFYIAGLVISCVALILDGVCLLLKVKKMNEERYFKVLLTVGFALSVVAALMPVIAIPF